MLARTESIAHVGSWEWDVATGAVIWSDELFRIFQLNPADGAPSFADQRKLYYPEDIQQLRKAVDAAVGNGKSYEMEMRAVRKDGATRVCLARGYAEKCLKKNSVIRLYGSLQDITDLKRAEQDYSMLFHKMLNGFALHEIICDESGKPTDYRFLAVNPVFERMTGLKAEKIVGRTVLEVMPYTEYNWIETYGKVAMTGTPIFFENYSSELNKYFEISAFRPNPNQFACIFADITERKKAEAEKIKLEGQLHQAQKLESVGRLAGGVAHDFNNMLSIILGHAEMALSQLEPDEAIHTSLEEIREAANRSANLTRQLLAFARRQTISPRKLDLNETIEGMLKLLQRLIGEDIDIVWLPGKNLWSVKVDPTQIDQILANLCINSRDSISGVGKMTIETRNCIFGKEYCASHLDFAPGEYVMLTVSDNGCGMDKETQAHIFEPFFTTKEMGKGTGLGLATVYGIIKQNSGFINVYSEVGQGSLFTVYFPRHMGESVQILNEGAAEPVKRGQETILLVEDEPAILNMTKMMLERQGYTVLSASKPSEAVRMAEAHPDKIDLLITDVVMPEISGWDLANNLLTLYPNIKRLFMSGYTANVIAHNGVLDPGVNFIQKPFSIQNLAAKVRESLDESNRKNKDDACDDE
jgi:PAS domain S-box-containing protein